MMCVQAALAQQQGIWEALKPYGKLFTFARNSQIYSPNNPARWLYLLDSGQVNLYIVSASGRAFTLQLVEAGGIFGHNTLVGGENYDTFAESVKPVRTVAISREDVRKLLATSPALGKSLVKEVGAYLFTTSRRIDEVAFKTVPSRLASVLLNMANSPSREPGLRLPRRTHQQLADMINSYRETVTKVINQFRADQLLDMDRSGITLLNMPRLQELARMGKGEPKP
jgi:CRP-like cAMP-binding protein